MESNFEERLDGIEERMGAFEERQERFEVKFEDIERRQKKFEKEFEDIEKWQEKFERKFDNLSVKTESIFEQTARLTEFRTEVNEKLDNIQNSIDFLTQKEAVNEREIYNLKQQYKFLIHEKIEREE